MRTRLMILSLAILTFWTAAALAGDATTDAWTKAMAYLQTAQQPDGSFSKGRGRVGMTAIILDALAAAPAAGKTDALKTMTDKAAAYLASMQQTEGRFAGAIYDPGAPANYCTSLSIVALAAYDKTKYQPVLARAVEWIKQQQCNAAAGYDREKTPVAFGGFGYGSSLRPDLSNTWMALVALRTGGVPVEDAAFQDALIFVRRCQNSTEVNDLKQFAGEDGGAMYLPGSTQGVEGKTADGRKIFSSTGSMTSAMLMAYLQCGLNPDARETKLVLAWLDKNWSADKNPNNKNDGQYAVYYYYRALAQALAASGVKTVGAHDWAKEITEALLKRQKPDGSWVNEVKEESEGDPALVTGYALSALAACGKARP